MLDRSSSSLAQAQRSRAAHDASDIVEEGKEWKTVGEAETVERAGVELRRRCKRRIVAWLEIAT